MDIPEQILVGVGQKNELTPGNSTLSIAKRFTGKSPDKKAIQSIKNWCGFKDEDEEPHLIENIPTKGFKIVGFQSRCRTDNKWFEVVDPRGFKLQVSCQNLMDIIQEEDLVRGVIQSNCVWGFEHSPYLIGIHSGVYQNYLKEQSEKEDRVKVTGSKLESGKLYSVADYGESIMMYIGRTTFVVENFKYEPYYNYGAWQNRSNQNSRTIKKRTITKAHTYFFAGIYGYRNGWNSVGLESDVKGGSFQIKATKTCPKVWETDETTTYDASLFADQIIKNGLKGHQIPYCSVDDSLSGGLVELKRKLIRFSIPELGIDHTF